MWEKPIRKVPRSTDRIQDGGTRSTRYFTVQLVWWMERINDDDDDDVNDEERLCLPTNVR